MSGASVGLIKLKFSSIAPQWAKYLGFIGFSFSLVACGTPINTSLPAFDALQSASSSVDYQNSSVSVSSSSVISGGSITVTASLRDSNFNAYISALPVVSFSAVGGTSTGTFGIVTNHNDGTYTALFTSTGAGTATTIHAFVDGNEITSTLPQVTVTSANYSLSTSVITLSSNTVQSSSTVTATLTTKDASGSSLSSGGLTVVFSNSGGSSTGTWSATTDHGDGTYTAVFTGVLAGSSTTIRSTIFGSSITSSLPTLTVTAGSASQLALVSPPTSVQSGVASGAFTVQLKDSAGNAVSLASKSITVGAYTSSACSSTASGTFGASSATTVSTNSSGVASFNSMTYTGSTGTIYLCATDTGDGYTLAQQAVTVSAGSLDHFSITGTTSSFAGSSNTYTITAKDVSNNTVTTYTSDTTLTSGDGAATYSPNPITSSSWSSGVATATVVFNTAGTYTLTATGSSSKTGTLSSIVIASPPTVSLQFSDSSGTVPRSAFSLIAQTCPSAVSGCSSTSTNGFPVGTPITLSRTSGGSLYSDSSTSNSVTVTITGVTAVTGSGAQLNPSSSSFTVTFGPSDTTKVIDSSNFGILTSATVTADTFFTLTLSNPTSNTGVVPSLGATTLAQVNLIDPNYQPSTYPAAGDAFFSNSFFTSQPGDSSVNLVVQRVFKNSGSTEKVYLSLMDGKGVSGVDYSPATSASGTDYNSTTQIVSFTGSSDTEKTVSVPIFPNTNGNHSSFYARLSNYTTFTGNVTSGSSTISNISSAKRSLLYVGEPISGYGIPAGATVASLPSSTSITISSNAIATLTTANFMATLPGSTRGQSIAKVRIQATNTTGSTCNASAATPFGGGVGTSGSPYLVCSMTQLSKTSGSYCDATNTATGGLSSSGSACNSASFYFKLMADMAWASPAATFSTFNANLDGNQSIIYNYSNSSGYGLFQTVSASAQSIIKNLNLLYANVSGGSAANIAVLINTNGGSTTYAATLLDDYVSAYLHAGNYAYQGMLVGKSILNSTVAANSSITQGMAAGSILGAGSTAGNLGGIIGGVSFSSASTSPNINLTDSYSTINMNAVGTQIGGILGVALTTGNVSGMNLNRNYSTGYLLSNTSYVGGIIGAFSTSKTSAAGTYAANYSISNNAFSGNLKVTGTTGTYGGGIAGSVIPTIGTSSASGLTLTMDSNVNTGSVSGPAYDGGIIGKANQNISGSAANSQILNITNNVNAGQVKGTYSTGNVGGIGGMQLCSARGGTIEVDRNTNLATVSTSYGSSTSYYAGIFGYSSTLNVVDVTYSLKNSWNSGAINGAAVGRRSGGIVGWLSLGNTDLAAKNNTFTVTGNASTGSVNGVTQIGGALGLFQFDSADSGNSIINNFATGDVTCSTQECGGFVGHIENSSNSVAISDSYATGNVTGGTLTGGFAGKVRNASAELNPWPTLTLSNCYSTGAVSGSGNYLGGFVGQAILANINSCYSTGNVSTAANIAQVGGFVGQMQGGTFLNDYSTGNVSDAGHTSTFVGGFAGFIYYDLVYGTNAGSISQSWESGSVSGNGTNANGSSYGGAVGGFVGGMDYGASITSCFATGGSTGVVGGSASTYAGGFVGQTWSSDSSSVNAISSSYTTASVTNGSGFLGYNQSGTALTSTNNYWIQNGGTTDGYITYTSCDDNITGSNAYGSRCSGTQLGDSTNSNWNFSGWDSNFSGAIWMPPVGAGGVCTTDSDHVCPSADYPYPTLHK